MSRIITEQELWDEYMARPDNVERVHSREATRMLKAHAIKEAKEWNYRRMNPVITIDYAQKKPLNEFFTSEIIAQLWDWEEGPETYLTAQRLSDTFRAAEEVNINSLVFIENPQVASLEQILSLSGLIVSSQNCSQLPNTYIIVPGGDWWYKPEFYHETLPDNSRGGGLSYVSDCRITEYGSFKRSNDLDRDTQELDRQLPKTLNIQGDFLTGKSKLLKQVWMLSSGIFMSTEQRYAQYFTVYPGQEDTILAEMEKRDTTSNVHVFIDDADKLAPDTLRRIMEQYPKLVLTSQIPIAGVERTLNLDQYWEK